MRTRFLKPLTACIAAAAIAATAVLPATAGAVVTRTVTAMTLGKVPWTCDTANAKVMIDEGKTSVCGTSSFWGPGWVHVMMQGLIGLYHYSITRQTQNFHEAGYWWPTIGVAGNYNLSVSFRPSANRASATPYIVYADDTTYLYRVNQRYENSEYQGAGWAFLGVHQFGKRTADKTKLVVDASDSFRKAAGWKVPPGTKGWVKIYNDPSNAVHSEDADAVYWEYAGPVTPKPVTARSNGLDGIQVYWSQPLGAAEGAITRYQLIRRSQNPDQTWTAWSAPINVPNVPVVARNYMDTQTQKGVNYEYRVRAIASVNRKNFVGTWTTTGAFASWTDTTPEDFELGGPVTNVEPSSVNTSSTITVSGLDEGASATIRIVGGQYKVNSGSYTSAAGTVVNGDKVTVQVTASNLFETTTTATLSIGALYPQTDTYEVTTRKAEDRSPDAFDLGGPFTVAAGATQDSFTFAVAGLGEGLSAPISISCNGPGTCSYSKDGGSSFTSAAGDVLNTNTVVVRIVSTAANGAATTATLTIGGVSDTFTVTTVAADMPNPFVLVDVANVAKSTGAAPNVQTSNSVTLSGFAGSAAISVTGGEYQIGTGSWTSTAGTVTSGSAVTVRGTASAYPYTKVSVVLTVGSYSESFDIFTGP